MPWLEIAVGWCVFAYVVGGIQIVRIIVNGKV
jgi:hypothetical protein